MKKSLIKLVIGFMLIFLIFEGISILVEKLSFILGSVIVLISVLTAILLFDCWYSRISLKQAFNNIGIGKTTIKRISPGIIISFLLLLLYPLFNIFLKSNVYLSESWIYYLTGIALTGGLAEEIFFRGFLFRHLREGKSFKQTVLLSMGMFASVHLVLFFTKHWTIALLSTLLAVVISLPLSYMYERAKNTIWSSALVHTTIRTIGLVFVIPEASFMQVTLLWLLACMVIPYLVVFNFTDLRKIWNA